MSVKKQPKSKVPKQNLCPDCLAKKKEVVMTLRGNVLECPKCNCWKKVEKNDNKEE